MWKALGVALCLSSTAATAVETAGDRAVWNEPLPLMLTPLGYSGLAVGANLPLNPDNDLVVEVMPFWTRDNCDSYCGAVGGFAAVGVSYRLFRFGGGARDGFFVQPKLVAHAERVERVFNARTRELTHEAELSVAIGVDVGYRMTFGNFFVAPILGASVGYASSINDYYPRFFPLAILGPNQSPWSEPVLGFDLNVHLLRVGFAF